jgi:deoxyadenosine/deoxycytidine kinase
LSLVFLCGPHGAGKTTLANRLKELPGVIMPELHTRSIKLHTTPYERIALKTCARALENYELSVVAQQHDGITLGNRCIYDTHAYAMVYRSLGWISHVHREYLEKLTRAAFPEHLKRPAAIILNPPFETVWQRLQHRWETGEKKWNEDNPDYCREACKAYERIALLNPHILYLTDNAVTPELLDWIGVEETV